MVSSKLIKGAAICGIGAATAFIPAGLSVANAATWVNNESIGMGMSLNDYLAAVVMEVGNPTFILTQSGLLAALQKASVVVEAEMHEKSTLVI